MSEPGKAAAENPTTSAINIPAIPSLPEFLLNWHPNLFDILMILWMLWSWFKTGTKPNLPADRDEYDLYVSNMITAMTSATSSFNTQLASYGINSPTYVTITAPNVQVWPMDKNDIFESIFDAYDSNNNFNNLPLNDINAIFDLSFSGIDIDFNELYNEYKDLKKTHFAKIRRIVRV